MPCIHVTSQMEIDASLEIHRPMCGPTNKCSFSIFLVLCVVRRSNSDNRCKKQGNLHFYMFPITKLVLKQWIHARCRTDKLRLSLSPISQSNRKKLRLISKPKYPLSTELTLQGYTIFLLVWEDCSSI